MNNTCTLPGFFEWAGFGLGALGIAFTIFQLYRSGSLLKKAAETFDEARTNLIRNQVVSVMPFFEEISKNIDDALDTESRDFLIAGLRRFSLRGSETAALLRASSDKFTTLADEIVSVVREANKAQSDLFGDRTSSLAFIASDAASSIRNLSSKIHGASVWFRNDIGKAKLDAR